MIKSNYVKLIMKINNVKFGKNSKGKNCFIGCNSLILKGTIIEEETVVGAGSVVSGMFPKNCVIAGNPAKVIKQL